MLAEERAKIRFKSFFKQLYMFVIRVGMVNFQVTLPLVLSHFLKSFPGKTGFGKYFLLLLFLCDKNLAFKDRATFPLQIIFVPNTIIES